MSKVQLHTATVNAIVDDSNTALLTVAYSSGLEQADYIVNVGGIPITLFTDGLGAFSMAVVDPIEDNVAAGSVDENDQANYTTMWRGQKLSLAEVNEEFALGVIEDGTGTGDITGTVTFRGMPMGVNDNGSLVLTKVDYFDPDEVQYISVGGNPLVARRKDSNWYLVVATYVDTGAPLTKFVTLDEATFESLSDDDFLGLDF